MYMDPSFAAATLPPEREPPSALLSRLCAGSSLGEAETEVLFTELVAGRLDVSEIAAMLVALKVKGETEAELTGAARALRAAALPFDRPDYLFADSCGTGGDSSSSLNLSTATAFVAAAAGLPVAKHGNRAVTSRCGSADVLEALGVTIDCSPERSRRALDEAGVCFLLAPRYHPGLRHAAPVRRQLRIRTAMNFLGPCLNPARPGVQLLGVADPRLVEPIARILSALGVERALVVHGDGLDEVALHGPTQAARLENGAVSSFTFVPEEAGVARAPLSALRGGGPEDNAVLLTDLLKGGGTQAERDAVAINTGALLMTAGLADGLRAGVALARDVLASGEAHRRLQLLVEISRG